MSLSDGELFVGIDTCGTVTTLALARFVVPARALEPLGSAELAGRTAAAELVPALKHMLSAAGCKLGLLAALVVVDGPGSFTGIRIGLSTAKALAEASGLPLYPISRLRVLASTHPAQSAVLDAGRGELYLLSAAGEALLTREELATEVPSGSLVACEEQVLTVLPGATLVPAPTALDALRAALPLIHAGHPPDLATLDGRYLRRSDLYRTSPVGGA